MGAHAGKRSHQRRSAAGGSLPSGADLTSTMTPSIQRRLPRTGQHYQPSSSSPTQPPSLQNRSAGETIRSALHYRDSVHSAGYGSIRRVRRKVADIFLSLDLWARILVFLPVKEIMKFKCVCKSWCELISSDFFIDMHLMLTKQTPRMILYPCTRYLTNSVVKLYSLNTESSADLLLAPVWGERERPRILPYACRGLNLLFSRQAMFVFNISTREFARLLPASPFGRDASGFPNQSVGLGFNSTSKKYIAVRNTYGFISPPASRYDLECAVYTLGCPDGWRDVCPPPYPVSDHLPVFSNGAIHWMIAREDCFGIPCPHALTSFSIEEETYTLVPLPSSTLPKRKEWLGLFVSQGSLWIAHCSYRESIADVWKLKDHHGGVWTREHRLDFRHKSFIYGGIPYKVHDGGILPIYSSYEARGFDRRGESTKQILKLGRRLSYYDSKERRIRNVCHEASDLFLTSHEDSLVSLRSIGRLEEFGSVVILVPK